MPLISLVLKAPPAGLPPIGDWLTCFWSILFSGLDLQREPLDVCVNSCLAGGDIPPGALTVVKGFTRASCVALICLAASEIDLPDASALDVLGPLRSVLDSAMSLPMTAPLCNIKQPRRL